MSQQLALSSLFSVLALATLCLASVHGALGDAEIQGQASQQFTLQAELAPGLTG